MKKIQVGDRVIYQVRDLKTRKPKTVHATVLEIWPGEINAQLLNDDKTQRHFKMDALTLESL